MYYINRKSKDIRHVETVDEFLTEKEAYAMRREYQMGDAYGIYYVSKYCCSNWR